MRDMSIYEERDGLLAEVARLTKEHKAAGIYAQTATDLRYAAEAAIERVEARCENAEDNRRWLTAFEIRKALATP